MQPRCWFFRLLLIGVMALTGCSSPGDASQAILRIGLETAPLQFDPRFALDAVSYRVGQLLYNSLVRLDDQAQIVPDLATSWDTPDATTYVFHLRRGVRWHDGTPLTAADVHYTFTSLLDPATQSPKRASFAMIRSVEVVSEHTIRFTLTEPFAPFLTNNMTLGIVPRRRDDTPPGPQNASPIGTGPFAFGRYEPNTAIHLHAYADYFDGRSALDGVVLRILPDPMVRLFELQKGNVDLLQNALPPDVLVALRTDARFTVLEAPGTNFTYVGLNGQDPILRHVQVRQALAHAIDRQALITHVFRGLAQPADGMLPASHWAYAPQVARYPFDLDRAAELLDAAGFPDPDGAGPQPRFRLVYKTSQDEVRRRVAEVIQESWRRLGVSLDIRSYEWGTFFGDIRAGNFQLYALTWVGVSEPDHFHYVLHSRSVPPAGANRGRYVNPRVDTLLEQGRRTTEVAPRRRLYQEAQAIVAAELPYISLWHQTNVAVLRATFTGYRMSPSGDFRAIRLIRPRPVAAASM